MNDGTSRAPQHKGRARAARWPRAARGLLALALYAGCDSGSATDSADLGGDAGSPDGGVAELQPRLVSASAAGHDRLFGVAFEPQGRFYATGVIADGTDAAADFKMLVARFNAAGELDPTFGSGGYAIKNVAVGKGGELARGIVVQSTGKVVISGTIEHAGAADERDRDVALVRWNADGTLDTSFGSGGVVTLDLIAGEVSGSTYLADTTWGLAVQPDDRLIVHAAQKRAGGTDTDFALIRLQPDGARDVTFGTQGVCAVDINNRSASPRNVTLLPDGSIIGSGYMSDGGVIKPVLYKVSGSGQLDTSFGNGGAFTQNVLTAATEAYSVVLQGTSLVTTGYGRNDASESLDWVSLRVSASGQLDPSYGSGGFVRIDVSGFSDNSRSLLALPDDRLLLLGGGRPTESNSDAMIAMLTANGQRDTTFSPNGYKLIDFGGSADFLWAGAVSPDKSRVALVGLKSSGTGIEDDDGVVLILPLAK
ncbi:MAG: hypothetical protein U1A78_19505 [Polyangia bacterium]